MMMMMRRRLVVVISRGERVRVNFENFFFCVLGKKTSKNVEKRKRAQRTNTTKSNHTT